MAGILPLALAFLTASSFGLPCEETIDRASETHLRMRQFGKARSDRVFYIEIELKAIGEGESWRVKTSALLTDGTGFEAGGLLQAKYREGRLEEREQSYRFALEAREKDKVWVEVSVQENIAILAENDEIPQQRIRLTASQVIGLDDRTTIELGKIEATGMKVSAVVHILEMKK